MTAISEDLFDMIFLIAIVMLSVFSGFQFFMAGFVLVTFGHMTAGFGMFAASIWLFIFSVGMFEDNKIRRVLKKFGFYKNTESLKTKEERLWGEN